MTEIMRLTETDLTQHVELGFRFSAPGGEVDFGEAQEDEVENGRGVFLGLEAGVSPSSSVQR
jgi:hypothetical protein